MVNSYWKVNDEIELASLVKSNWRYPSWSGQNFELGAKYKISKQITCGVKAGGDGNITTGTWLKKDGKVSTVLVGFPKTFFAYEI